jgi:hypothetical protein
VGTLDGSTVVKEEAQFASLVFKYPSDVDAPVVCYKDKWRTTEQLLVLFILKKLLVLFHHRKRCLFSCLQDFA